MIPADGQLLIDKICRSCMSESTNMCNVFDNTATSDQNQKNLLLSEMLMACAQIEVSLGDGLPYLLCSTCESKLNTAFDFKAQCEKSDTTLRELTKRHSNKEKANIITTPDKYQVLSDSEDDNVPLIKSAKSEIITETNVLSCKFCQQTLPGKRALKVHTRLHKGDGTRYCPVCPSKYAKLNSFLKHLQKHNKKDKLFSCAICLTKFNSTEDLYNHLEKHKEELRQETEKVKPIKVKIEVKEEKDDVRYELAGSTDEKFEEVIRIEVESNKKQNDDFENMDDTVNSFPFSDNDDADNGALSEIENIFKKRKRGRPRTRDPFKRFPCSECGKVLTTNLGLKIHLKKHGIIVESRKRGKSKKIVDTLQGQAVECEFCDRKFKYRKSYIQHMRLEHGISDDEEKTEMEVDKPVVNDSTNPVANNNELIDESTEMQSERIDLGNIQNRPEEILEDQSNIALESGMLNHADKIVKKEKDDIMEKVKAKKTYECQVCGAIFERLNHLTRHMILHRALLTHKCDLCVQSFYTEQLLKKHIEEDHTNKPYNCTICDKSFTRGEHLIRHLKVHKPDIGKILKCSICEVTVSRSDHLARHTKTHIMQDKRHVCRDCGKAFNRLDNLKTHQKVHTGLKGESKLHLCIYCGKEFNNSSNLIVHMRRHTGERPYKCSVCDKGFPRSHDLKCHERIHSGEKPYLCTLCGKSFNKSNKLLRHSRVHTGERPYVCNICGRAFTQSNDLALHMRRHTGARPYACGMCPARFIQSAQLKSHRKTTGHWMETQPDLKGGHRVEQISGPVESVPIRFKKYNLKKEAREDGSEVIDNSASNKEQHNQETEKESTVSHPHKVLMGIMGNLKMTQNEMQSLIIDNTKLVELQGGGFGIMTLPPAIIQAANGQEIKLKTELGSFDLEPVDDLGKEEVVVTSELNENESYAVPTTTAFNGAENFGFQTFD